jgi:hypothetical protein
MPNANGPVFSQPKISKTRNRILERPVAAYILVSAVMENEGVLAEAGALWRCQRYSLKYEGRFTMTLLVSLFAATNPNVISRRGRR